MKADMENTGKASSTCAARSGGATWRRGFTTLELLLAMSMTVVIGAAVATMLSAASYGTSSSRDLRELVVRGKTLSIRINDAIRQADRVLAVGEDYLVLWTDHDDDGEPSVHELRRLQHDADTGTLVTHTASESADEITWPVDADFTAITDSLMAGSSFPPRQWASGVTHWQITPDADQAPRQIRLISYRLTLAAGDLSESAVNAAALRNR